MTDATTRPADQERKDQRLVLAMFAETCPVPTGTEIQEWCEEHPQHAKAIRELAGDLLADEAFGQDAPDPTPAELKADRRMAAEMAARITGHRPTGTTVAELLAAASIDVPQLADVLGIDRVVLADIEEGSIALPIGRKVAGAIAEALKKPLAIVQDAIINSALAPSMGYAKAEGAPSAAQIPYEQAILESDMTDDRKAFWLED